jgi:Bacterial regulatory proteins, luxR family
MAILLTRDERLVLRYRASGKSTEEIAAALNWPLEAVRWTCTHPLITWVLDELEAKDHQGRLLLGQVER